MGADVVIGWRAELKNGHIVDCTVMATVHDEDENVPPTISIRSIIDDTTNQNILELVTPECIQDIEDAVWCELEREFESLVQWDNDYDCFLNHLEKVRYAYT